MFRELIGGIVGLAMMGMAGSADALPILDQENTVSPTNAIAPSSFQQTITAGIAGSLNSVEFSFSFSISVSGADLNFSVTANILDGLSGPVLGSDTQARSGVGNHLITFDFSGANIFFDIGDVFAASFSPIIPPNTVLDIRYNTPSTYSGGGAFFGASVINGDAFFRSHMDQVPEPSTLALFGTGLAGLGFVMRRRRLMYLKAA